MVCCCSFEVFGWAEEPVVCDDDEVDDVSVEGPVFRVVEGQGVEEAS